MSGTDRIMTAIAWALALSTLVAVVEVTWFHIEPLGLFSNRDFFAEAAAPVFVWARSYEKAKPLPRDNCRHDSLGALDRYAVGVQILLACPLIFCGSRLSVLAVMAGIAIARPRWWWQTLIALPILAELGTKAMGYHGKLASLKERGEMWHTTAFSVTPWGHGMGWFAIAHPRWGFAHSDALQALSELGVGIIPFALIVGWLVHVEVVSLSYCRWWRIWRPVIIWRTGKLRGPLVASLVTVCGGFALHEAGSGLVAAVLAGGVVAAEARARRERNTLCVSGDSVDDHSRRAATSG